MVFYFTGTGNSLYVAKCLETEPISIPQVIKNEKLNFIAKEIGIVALVYGHEVPPMVKEFMKKAAFHTDYFYIVLTYGNRHGGAAELTERFCRECGIQPDYINVLLMVDNWLPGFDMEQQRLMDKKIEEHLKRIISDVHSHKNMISEVTDYDRRIHDQFLDRMKQSPDNAWKNLVDVSQDCVGCGVCAKVCPSGSILMEEGKAIHILEKCQTCLACVHHCPSGAMRLNVPEKNPNARYRNENIHLEEIVAANNQY